MSFPIRARSLSALLLPAVLALTACQAPALDEQDSACLLYTSPSPRDS